MPNEFPKLPGKPECLGFRKTVTFNLQEHQALNMLLDDGIRFCNENQTLEPKLLDTAALFMRIRAKLNAETPPQN